MPVSQALQAETRNAAACGRVNQKAPNGDESVEDKKQVPRDSGHVLLGRLHIIMESS